MHARTEYACGISVVTQSGGTAEDFASAVGREALERATGFALLFHSIAVFDTNALATALARHAPGLAYAGCTTAGEMTPEGITDGNAVAILLPRENFVAVSSMIENIRSSSMDAIAATVEGLRRDLAVKSTGRQGLKRFAMCLIDGMSFAEEAVTAAIHWALDDIPLVGGSAGDDLKFDMPVLIHGGRVRTDAAIVLLFATDIPFHIFKTDSFIATDEKFVVTASDPDRRVVMELNGQQAALEYAAALGKQPEILTQLSFASSPVIVRVGGERYCRAIRAIGDDGFLAFACAIDDGVVLTLAESRGMVDSTRQTFLAIGERLGGIDIIVGFDCAYRRVDAANRQVIRAMSDLYRKYNVVGFGTYGEQYNSMHLNQTLVGIAFGRPAKAALRAVE